MHLIWLNTVEASYWKIEKKKLKKTIYMIAARESEWEIRQMISFFKVTKRCSGSDAIQKAILHLHLIVTETTFQKNRYRAWAELIWFQYF